MDILAIEDEIYKFNDIFFKDCSSVVEDGLNFLEDNHLEVPKENYTILFDYLNPVFNYFRNLDYQAIGSTLSKLHLDVKYLNITYKDVRAKSLNIKEVYEKSIIKHSQILSTMSKEVNKYKNIVNISRDDKRVLNQKVAEFTQLKKIYYESFEKTFTEDKRFFLSSLLKILNTKTYYLERLLWLEVSQSEIILNSLKELQSDEPVDSKAYLTYKLSVIMPYSEDYKYLQKCLRVFK